MKGMIHWEKMFFKESSSMEKQFTVWISGAAIRIELFLEKWFD
jgi:hypothetical protein